MNTKPLQVMLRVEAPSVVALTLGDTVQLDRLTPSADGVDAARHGPLLTPGVTTIALDPGDYAFRTLCDAELQVVTGGVVGATTAEDKDPWPDPKILLIRGDAPRGESPRLLVR